MGSMTLKGLLITAAFVFLETATAQAEIIPAGRIAHYALDETSGAVIDSEGNFNGTNNGATRGVAGVYGSAFEFNGSTSFIDTLPQANIPTNFTISLWIHPTGTSGQIFGSVPQIQTGPHGLVAIYYNHDSYATNGLPHSYQDSVAAIFYHDRGRLLSPRNSFPLNTWSHLTLSYDSSGSFKIYANGVLMVSDLVQPFATPLVHDRALMFGKAILSQNVGFDGKMDDIMIWDRVLTDSEVAGLLTCPVLSVEIDIKPGSDTNPISLRSKGKTPVAILSSLEFDATLVDEQTVQLNGEGVAVTKSGKLMANVEDVNDDGLPDLVCHFVTQNLDVDLLQDGFGLLDGQLLDGTLIEGIDVVEVVP